MTAEAFLSHLAFLLFLVVVSAGLTRFMIHRVAILDIPNERSSHDTPRPKSGGVAIVATFFFGVMVIAIVARMTMIDLLYFFGMAVSGLLVAGISFYDDIRSKSYLVKLTTQFVAVVAALLSGLVINGVTVPGIGLVDAAWLVYPVTFLWITGLTNAFNFMDGIDGLAGGTALIAAVFFCAITYLQGSHFVYIMSYAIIAGTLGFLLYNFPPARIFMGDVGSAFLGFIFAVLAIIAARYDHAQTPLLVIPLLLFHFIYDTVFTFCRRLLRGEKVTQAHRSHLYQLFQRLGHTHLTVSVFYWILGILQGAAAIWMAQAPTNDRRILFFLPFLAIQAIYSTVIVRAARRAGLLEGGL